MRVDKRILESVNAEANFGQIICCALYLNAKAKKDKAGAAIHEQVAILRLQGNDEAAIARKTGFEKQTVHGALKAIAAFCGAGKENLAAAGALITEEAA
jgi:hypothetical protein